MKKEERSKLMKLLDYIASKGFRDSVKNIFITLVVIGIVVIVYFYFVEYSARKVRESTGIDMLKEISKENGNGVQYDLGLTEVSSDAYILNGKLNTRLVFSTNMPTYSFAKLSGNNKVINQTSDVLRNQHEFVFDMQDNDYGALFVYTVIVGDASGQKQKVLGKVMIPEKPEITARISLN